MTDGVSSVYMAARFERRAELNEYRLDLKRAGIEVTSHWLTVNPPAPVHELTDDDWRTLALTDIEDIRRADAFVLFAEGARDGGGGRHTEFGMALAWEKRMIVVGDAEHLFHRMPDVTVVDDWTAAQSLLIGSLVS